MKYGNFDDEKREYVINDPKTPYPWINYLGTQKFFSLISNTAGGYSFYQDALYQRITRYRYNNVPTDAGGRYFYINDNGTVWSPGWKPVKTPLDQYECRHGMGYTVIKGRKNDLSAEVLFFVPQDKPCEIQKMTLTNEGSGRKEFKLFSFIEFCLWNASTDMENFQRNFSTGEVEIHGGTIYHKTEYRERRNYYSFYHSSVDPAGYDTDRETFFGLYNEFSEPDVVFAGKAENSKADGWSPIASHYFSITLEPGESKEFVFILGFIQNDPKDKWESPKVVKKDKALQLISECSTIEGVDREFNKLNAFWDDILGSFVIKSGDDKLDRMVNIWNQYQCMVTYNMARSASYFESGIGRGIGFRDTNQDVLGCMHQIPARVRERIMDVAATQLNDGGAYHQYQPLTKKGNDAIGSNFNDDPLWLILSTAAYIKETGKWDILDEVVDFENNSSLAAPMMEHLRRSFNHVISNLGPHGLPLIGRADWNDCLNLNCFSDNPNDSFQTSTNKDGKTAESLMIAGMFVYIGREWVEILKRRNLDAEADAAVEKINRMSKAVEQYGWDGGWYLRAYDDAGEKVGSSENKEGKIFIESQGWCTMAEIGVKSDMPVIALDSVKKYLDSPYGIVLLNPAFSKYYIEYGEISSYPEGYKENAGIFCHNNPWVMIGEAIAGRGEYAWDYYTKIAPAWLEDISEIHRTEPYVYSQMIAGKEAPRHGEAKNSWLTGTAAWNFVAVSQWILGIRPDFDGLRIKPILPADLKGFHVQRKLRGNTFDIEVKNETGSGNKVVSAVIDGIDTAVESDGSLVVPVDGSDHTVVVELGK